MEKNIENKLDIVQEKFFCKLVRQLPVIFDKSHRGYKEKDTEVNAWIEIVNFLDFISNGIYYILATV